MVAITEEAIREIGTFRGEGAPVTTCYLDVDGRRMVTHREYERELDRLLRRAKTKGDSDSSVVEDLRRIEDYVRSGFDRSRTRGLVIFACSARRFWKVLPLPVPVRNQLVVNQMPAVRQLERVVRQFERIGVLLVDKQRARMFVFELGELVDRSELFEELPRDYDDRGDRERGEVQHHVEALAAQHLRHAAAVAFHVFQEWGFDHLTIGASDEIAGELENDLHPYLRERLSRRVGVAVGAGLDEIRTAVLEAEADIERARESGFVESLREAVGAGRRGVAGLAAVLAALVERRVSRLLVSHGYSEPGWRCKACGHLGQVGRGCPVCSADMVRVDDVVEEAVEEALAQSCEVEVCVDNADLDVLGRIGALLRY